MPASIHSVELTAKIMIQVGDQQVELAALAQALTKAGVELQAITNPSGRTVESTSYTGKRRIEHVCLEDGLLPGQGVFLGSDGKLHNVELKIRRIAAYEVPQVEGYITSRI